MTITAPSAAGKAIRAALRWLLIIIASLIGLLLAGGVWLYQDTAIRQRPVTFDRPLAIPPLAPWTLDEQGRKVFDLTTQAGESELLPGIETPTWGYDGSYLGPTLRAAIGDEVVVNLHNSLPEATTTHWHGMELPAAMDGGPHQMIQPGQTWSPAWRIEQPAATLWYHPHPHGATALHVYRGLAGLFLLDDPATDGSLPHEYGLDDVPLIVQDRRFAQDGSSDFHHQFHRVTGMLGDTIVVNGTVGPVFEARTELVRFRLVNASPARVYAFAFDDRRQFMQVATDVGLLPEPLPLRRLQLSPGERAEIVVGFAPGEEVVLISELPELGANALVSRLVGGHDRFQVLKVAAAETLERSLRLPAVLSGAPAPEPTPSAASVDRSFVLGDFTINDRTMDHHRIYAHVTSGTTEVWELYNASLQPHNWHVHGARFQVLPERQGQALAAHHLGWKDTVYVAPGARLRLAVTFPDHSDEEHPYMFHCHILYHEDNGMMGQFLLVAGSGEL